MDMVGVDEALLFDLQPRQVWLFLLQQRTLEGDRLRNWLVLIVAMVMIVAVLMAVMSMIMSMTVIVFVMGLFAHAGLAAQSASAIFAHNQDSSTEVISSSRPRHSLALSALQRGHSAR